MSQLALRITPRWSVVAKPATPALMAGLSGSKRWPRVLPSTLASGASLGSRLRLSVSWLSSTANCGTPPWMKSVVVLSFEMLPPPERISAPPATLRLRAEKSAKTLFRSRTRELETLLWSELPLFEASMFPAKVQWVTLVWTKFVGVSFST